MLQLAPTTPTTTTIIIIIIDITLPFPSVYYESNLNAKELPTRDADES